MSSPTNKTVSLVLGSGGARGLAHIGVIHWLEEHDFKIESISGSSMGSLIGGVYAAGKLDEFEQWVCAITKIDMVSLMDLAWSKNGLIKGDKIINSLVDLVGEQLIEDLPLRFTSVASDIVNEKEVWIQSGKLFDAIRASISLPLFFTPFNINGVDLIDGGILNPVPIAPTFGDNTDLTIAVNLGGPPKIKKTKEIAPTSPSFLSEELHDKISNFISSFQETLTPNSHDWSAYDVTNQAFEAMQSTIARQKLAAYPPDITIEVPRNICGIIEFNRASEMIELGYDMAQKRLSHLIKDA
ncbi:MAG: patatin-like phospholipase family protein [Pseudomonadota bacterium]|nr:patatin-like phospholipase family protein [Pseudomonadota bacterium]